MYKELKSLLEKTFGVKIKDFNDLHNESERDFNSIYLEIKTQDRQFSLNGESESLITKGELVQLSASFGELDHYKKRPLSLFYKTNLEGFFIISTLKMGYSGDLLDSKIKRESLEFEYYSKRTVN